jgi:hypothetical protein
MRRLLLAAALLCAGACRSPAPCTQALCPLHFDGNYRVSGWDKSVTVSPGQPALPVVSDSTVDVLSGRVEFVNRRAVVRASQGASFRFEVSTAPVPVSAVTLLSGAASVALSSTAAPSPLTPGVPYSLPAAE